MEPLDICGAAWWVVGAGLLCGVSHFKFVFLRTLLVRLLPTVRSRIWLKCHYMRQLEAEMLKGCDRLSPVDVKWIPAMKTI